MRKIWLLACLAMAMTPCQAHQSAHRHHVPAASDSTSSDAGYYTNSRGNRVHRPVRQDRQPSGATAKCGDGSWSFSQSLRGTCSHHGGVQRWL
jgi:hypothetical protein